MDEHGQPEEAADTGGGPVEEASPTDAENEAEAEAEANLLAKIEMTVYGHP